MSWDAILYLRSDIAWRTLDAEQFFESGTGSAAEGHFPIGLKRRVQRGVEIWNRVFAMSYFDYRQRLKDIAALNWSRLRHISLIVRDADRLDALKLPHEGVVIPVDDDDWFHPDIVSMLRDAYEPGIGALHWPDAILRSVVSQLSFAKSSPVWVERRNRSFFYTNGYAVTASGLKRQSLLDRRQVLMLHGVATETFDRPEGRRFLARRGLSVANKSLASVLNIREIERRGDLLRNLRRLKSPLPDPPVGFAWAKEYALRMVELNRELACSATTTSGNRASVRMPGAALSRSRLNGTGNERRDAGRIKCLPGNRREVINWLIRLRGYKSYLEIGCAQNRTFNAVIAPHKVGIDCQQGGTLHMSSNEFFRVNREQFDIVFIDGLHLREQVVQDVNHALACLKPEGCIVLHDCLPKRREHQERRPKQRKAAWTGDVWKAVVELRQRSDCDVAVLDADWGLGVLFARPNSDPLPKPAHEDWAYYVAHRDRLLRVVDAEGLCEFVTTADGQPCTVAGNEAII